MNKPVVTTFSKSSQFGWGGRFIEISGFAVSFSAASLWIHEAWIWLSSSGRVVNRQRHSCFVWKWNQERAREVEEQDFMYGSCLIYSALSCQFHERFLHIELICLSGCRMTLTKVRELKTGVEWGEEGNKEFLSQILQNQNFGTQESNNGERAHPSSSFWWLVPAHRRLRREAWRWFQLVSWLLRQWRAFYRFLPWRAFLTEALGRSSRLSSRDPTLQ